MSPRVPPWAHEKPTIFPSMRVNGAWVRKQTHGRAAEPRSYARTTRFASAHVVPRSTTTIVLVRAKLTLPAQVVGSPPAGDARARTRAASRCTRPPVPGGGLLESQRARAV